MGLILGISTFLVVGTLFALGSEREGVGVAVDYDVASVAMRAVRGMSGWLWVAAIMGFAVGSAKKSGATREANRDPRTFSRVGSYTAEAVLPFYVLHQTVIVLLAFYVVEWQIHATLK